MARAPRHEGCRAVAERRAATAARAPPHGRYRRVTHGRTTRARTPRPRRHRTRASRGEPGGGMSRPPRDELTPVEPSTGFDAVVLQQFVHTNGPDRPLSTSDLTYREVRDGLWLAQRLHRPEPAPVPPPAEEP